MPIYEYKCPKCEKIVELQAKMNDGVSLAPMCCEEDCNCRMDRIISKTGFSLKGHGWARDGYKGKK